MSNAFAGGWYVTTPSKPKVSSGKWRTSDEATSRANGVTPKAKPKAKPKSKPTRKKVKAKKSQVRGAVGAGVLTVREIELLARQEKYAEKQKAERLKQVGDYL
jgi:hypothetical protein